MWNLQFAIQYAMERAQSTSIRQSIVAVRRALIAGGCPVRPCPNADEMGQNLRELGFIALGDPAVAVTAGDILVISPCVGEPSGHLALYNGSDWVSDFVQSSIYPSTAFRQARPPYRIFRHADVVRRAASAVRTNAPVLVT